MNLPSNKRRNDLERIPGVGPNKISKDLKELGIHRVSDLRHQDPEHLYQALRNLKGKTIDRCVLYVFRCAMYFADHEHHDPELLKWWN